jgi:formylglycine-generating enzyme required for sulfatase activity
MHNEPREKLRELIVEYGRSLCDDPRRCEALLKDYCGQYKREIFVLISALKNRVADDLLKAPAGVPQVSLFARLIKRLEDELGLAETAAKWAVESWALALCVIDQPKSAPTHPPVVPYNASLASSAPLISTPISGFQVPVAPVLDATSVRIIEPVRRRIPAELSSLKPLFSIFHDRLRDGSPGPAMIVIPAGEFWMGSPDSESERGYNERRHWVKIEQPFAIGQYAVTFDEYDRFCVDQGKKKPNDERWGRGNRPVINVNGLNALNYTDWLSMQTGKTYRLPTEAEWEYAARAGTETAFWWGNNINPDQANYYANYTYRNGAKSMLRAKTVSVDQFQPNPWGLYQVHGNVSEWTCSEMYDNYGGSELLCADKDTSYSRAVRGGSWFSHPDKLRSAYRLWASLNDRDSSLTGFRLARYL